MTEKYNFTNKSIKLGQKLAHDLDDYCTRIEVMYINHPEGSGMMDSLTSLLRLIGTVKRYQLSNTFDLDDILKCDHLTFTEVLFILHGLYPPPRMEILEALEKDLYAYNCYDYGFLVHQLKNQNKAYTQLSSAITAGKESPKHGLQSDSRNGVYTDQFIPWAMDKGFIRPVDEKTKSDNIAKHNNNRASIAAHNKKVVLEEYQNWTPILDRPKSPYAFSHDMPAYEKLKLRLKPLLTEGEDGSRKTLEKSTIEGYIRAHKPQS